jgi:ketosteroid isomerase-like protein
MSQENVEVVRRMLDAFNRDDVEAVVAAFDASYEINEPLEMPDSPAMWSRLTAEAAPARSLDHQSRVPLRNPTLGLPWSIGAGVERTLRLRRS